MKSLRFRCLGGLALAVLFLWAASPAAAVTEEPAYDVLIRNGLIYDGSGGPPFRADVAVKGGMIVRVGKGIQGGAGRVIEARGLAVAPGFIDMHTHVDEDLYFPERRSALNYLRQGVTTIVGGQCGGSAWPIFEKAQDQVERFTQEGVGPNAALLVGHGTVRRLVMGYENRPPAPEELEKMKALVREAMEQGAAGISTGLIYLPGTFAKTDEVAALVREVAPYGGIYHSHVRNERDKLLDAVREAIFICEATGVPTHISHFKVMGRANWGLVQQACALIEEARARGLKVTADQYPFRFSNGNPYVSLVPRQVWLGAPAGRDFERSDLVAFLDALRDAELIRIYEKLTPYFPLSERHRQFLDGLSRRRLVEEVSLAFSLGGERGPESERERALFWSRWSDPLQKENILKAVNTYLESGVGVENWVVGVCPERSLEGLSLPEAARRLGKSVEEAAVELELMGARCIPLQMCEPDIETIMRRDYVATGSDGGSPPFGIGLPHMRSYSTFLYKISEYALKRGVLSVARAIRSQTGLPAEIMNWPDRGRVKQGCAADLVVLDLGKLKAPSSITSPHVYAQGVAYLLVNGRLSIDAGKGTGVLAGRVLKPSRKPPS